MWLRFMFPSVPGFGWRIWMICVIRASGWLTGTRHAGVSVRGYTPSHNKAPRAADAGLRGYTAEFVNRRRLTATGLISVRHREYGPVEKQT